jgi:hypothetical protein
MTKSALKLVTLFSKEYGKIGFRYDTKRVLGFEVKKPYLNFKHVSITNCDTRARNAA